MALMAIHLSNARWVAKRPILRFHPFMELDSNIRMSNPELLIKQILIFELLQHESHYSADPSLQNKISLVNINDFPSIPKDTDTLDEMIVRLLTFWGQKGWPIVA